MELQSTMIKQCQEKLLHGHYQKTNPKEIDEIKFQRWLRSLGFKGESEKFFNCGAKSMFPHQKPPKTRDEEKCNMLLQIT